MLGSLAATMPVTNPSWPEPRLILQSQLEDLTLVWPWVQALTSRYSVSAQTQFAIELCLEEALSNVMRYGYRGQENQSITVDCALGAGELVFTIQDHAPLFDPFAPSADSPAPAPASIDELLPGGQGIRLIRKFASRVAWEPLLNGNRLTLAFTLPS
jgi:anti-sigma regulatory factor (Ser/Thr protein kinase)